MRAAYLLTFLALGACKEATWGMSADATPALASFASVAAAQVTPDERLALATIETRTGDEYPAPGLGGLYLPGDNEIRVYRIHAQMSFVHEYAHALLHARTGNGDMLHADPAVWGPGGWVVDAQRALSRTGAN